MPVEISKNMLIATNNLTKTYGGNLVFEDVSILINEGDRIALIGENGAGKSTLFKILAGQSRPDSGQVTANKGVTIGYLTQEAGLDSEQTLYEYAIESIPKLAEIEQRLGKLGSRIADPEEMKDAPRFEKLLNEYSTMQDRYERGGGYTIDAKVKSVLAGLGFTDNQITQRLGSFSGGEKKMAGLARLLIQQPDLLLLDEPDNHLDLAAKEWLHNYILNHKGSVLVISHDRYFLDQFVNHIYELEDHRLHEYLGNYTAAQEAKQRRLEKSEELYRLHQRELIALEKSAKQLQEWAALNKKLAGRARNRKRLLAVRKRELEETPIPILERKTIDVTFAGRRSGQAALTFKSLGMSIGSRVLFDPFDLRIKYGERVGIVGPNGTGKTTLFRIILGETTPTHGSVELGTNVQMGYYSQEQETLDPGMSPVDFVRHLKPMYENEAVAFLKGRLLFDYDDCFKPISSLSGGEKSRLQLTRVALEAANFLLLDEPTNNLDIPSMEVLEAAIDDFDGTILAISHDRYFLDRIVTRIVAIENGRVEDVPGDFSYYYEKKGGKVSLGR
jgi:ATP-binding cassette subfamily F protein 3